MAVTHRERLVRDFPRQSEHNRDLAFSEGRLAYGLYLAGQIRESEEIYRRAIHRLEALPFDLGKTPDCRFQMGVQARDLAAVLSVAGNAKESRVLFYEGKAILEKLVRDFPQEAMYRNELGWTFAVEASWHLTAPTDVQEAYRQALSIGEKLLAEAPTVPEYRYVVGTCSLKLGVLFKSLGRCPEAEAALQRSVACFEKLVGDHPSLRPRAYLPQLEQSYVNLIDVLRSGHRTEEAQKLADQRLAFWRRLAVDLSKDSGSRENEAHLRESLAQAYTYLGQWEQAEAEYTKAIELEQKRWEVWSGRATVQLRLKHWAKALADCSQAIERAPPGLRVVRGPWTSLLRPSAMGQGNRRLLEGP
jgi:tetratricopeptide (TPR) repeat protein